MCNYGLNQDFAMKKGFDFWQEQNKKCFSEIQKFFQNNCSCSVGNDEMQNDFLSLCKKYAVNNCEQVQKMWLMSADFYNDYMSLMQKHQKN